MPGVGRLLLTMEELDLDKYENFWVLASKAKTRHKYSPYFDVPPVRLIPLNDRVGLKAVIAELLAEKPKRIPMPDLNVEKLGIRPEAVGEKSNRAYQRKARVFLLQRSDERLSIEEWKREKGGWVADPYLWKEGGCQTDCVNGNNQLTLFRERIDDADYTGTLKRTAQRL